MKKNYDRTICNECPIKKRCEEYRNKNWCIKCDASLWCLINGKQTRPMSCMEMHSWRTQYRRCLLVNSLFIDETQSRSFIKTESNQYLCPRCLNSSFKIYTYNKTGLDDKLTKYCYGNCVVCDVYTPTKYV